MRTAICETLGCEVPIFAFSHCRDVVAGVTRAGGFGVLGGSTFTPEQFARELDWIDEHTGDGPYGVDVLVPSTYDARADVPPEELERLIPQEHRDFLDAILAEHGVPELPPEERTRLRRELAAGRGAMTPDGARRLVDIALTHPRVGLVASALGTPPPDVVAQVHEQGRLIGALCGRARHAEKHVAAGVDLVVAQGTEAGGHTGDITTMVLVPDVVAAVAGRAAVVAAGGITHGSQVAAALAMGAQGVWTGTVWLGTRESELDDFERRRVIETPAEGTVRGRARTGKTVRMIRSALSDAWEAPGAPAVLPTPLQGVLYNEAHARVVRARADGLFSFPVGQSVGAVRGETTVAEVMYRLQEELGEALERLGGLS
ncbi:nitronate monooxygenase [Pseudonocardia sp. RS010]|uniref:nitronate monooxygenase n=1 Tax=Pseudonocardia sp. RS010 TaxID=3385979 RepID=UPI0039A29803